MLSGEVERVGAFGVPGIFSVVPKDGKGAVGTLPRLGDVWDAEGSVNFPDV